MLNFIDKILTNLESGEINRRQAVARLATMMVGVIGANSVANAPQSSEAVSTFQATGLNHLALRISDVARTRDFYRKHLGLTVLRDNAPYNCFMGCGENFVALFRSNSPGMDHYCYTIENYDPDETRNKLKQAGIDSRRQENRIYFDDPDGLTIQLSGKWGAWPGRPPQ